MVTTANHLNELDGHVFAGRQLSDTLHLNRQRVREAKEHAGEHRLDGTPLPKIKAASAMNAPRGHVSREER
jgi:hypothetical protein